MYELLSEHYDNLYSLKDYELECDVLEGIIKKYSYYNVANIVDVGCGTGNHSVILSKRNYNVVGVDISEDMIKQAVKKQRDKCRFFVANQNFYKKNRNKFELAISLFNVVNHVLDLKSLDDFFSKINTILKEKSLFIFDCWNQNAVILDRPTCSKSFKSCNNHNYETNCKPTYDWINSSVLMENIVVIDNQEIVKYSLDSVVWQNKVYLDLLNKNGFSIIEIKKAFDMKEDAKENFYKLMFICKKDKKND